MASTVVIRSLNPEDLGGVASVHMAAFPDSALARLGLEAVRRYYAWLLEGPHDAVRLGAWAGTELVGFCFGGIFRGAMTGFLNKNRMFLVARVLLRPWMIANPIFRDRLLNAARILGRTLKRPAPLPAPEAASAKPFGILAIAVDPARQGLGVGRRLMRQAETLARASGFRQMILTVSPSNHQAIRFYEHQQWIKVVGKTAWEGRMKKLLDAATEASAPRRFSSFRARQL